MLIDMHVNGTADDGTPRDPRRTLELAAKAGLDGILVVAAPGTIDRAAWLGARGDDGPRVFFAVPVATARGDFLCIPRSADDDCVPADWSRAARREPLSETALLERMRGRNGALVAVQPYTRRPKQTPPGDLVFAFDGIHGVEVRTLETDPMDADMAIEAGLGMRLPCLSGSGDRRPEPELGSLATLFAVRITSQGGLVDALVSGEAWPVLIERPQGGGEAGGKDGRRRRRRRGKGPRPEAGGSGPQDE